MTAQRNTGHRLLVATVAVAVAGLAAGPAASARAKPPVKPKASSAKTSLQAQPTRAIISLGYDSRAGFEVFVVTVEGSGVIGMPFG